MTALVFVHGISIRKVDYDRSFGEVAAGLQAYCATAFPVACLWGDQFGASLTEGGDSIPDYEQTKAIPGTETPAESDQVVALWDKLYDHPLFELQLLALRPPGTDKKFIPGQANTAEQYRARVEGINPQASKSLSDALMKAEVPPETLRAAIAELTKPGIGRTRLEAAEAASADDPAELNLATARALVALVINDQVAATQASRIAENKPEQPPQELLPLARLAFDAAARDELTASLVKELTPLQEKTLVGRWMKSAAEMLATRHVLSRRGRYTRAIVPFVGDVLTYQAHGESIRGKIKESLTEATEGDPSRKVVLLGHSLGGVACVDLLALDDTCRARVDLLITVGSQAPLLYEMNALQGCPNRRPLPQGFPSWLNIYDRRDFLSYIAVKIFDRKGPKSVTDAVVDNSQPFPESHSAYWTNPQTWQTINAHLP